MVLRYLMVIGDFYRIKKWISGVVKSGKDTLFMVLRDAIALLHACMADLSRGSRGRGSGSEMTTHDVTQGSSFTMTCPRSSLAGRVRPRVLCASWIKESSFNSLPFCRESSFSGPDGCRDWCLAGTTVRCAKPSQL